MFPLYISTKPCTCCFCPCPQSPSGTSPHDGGSSSQFLSASVSWMTCLSPPQVMLSCPSPIISPSSAGTNLQLLSVFLPGLVCPRCGSRCLQFLLPVHVLIPETAGSWEWQHSEPWLFLLLLWGAEEEQIQLSPYWAKLETALCIWCFKRTMLESSPEIYNLAKCDLVFLLFLLS